jgi:thiamine biosynthesis lipoprotein
MIFDLGALGKGYALDQAADVLAMHGVHNAVLNAGDSTVLAIGTVHPDGAMPTVVVNLDAGGITRVTGNALYGVTAN